MKKSFLLLFLLMHVIVYAQKDSSKLHDTASVNQITVPTQTLEVSGDSETRFPDASLSSASGKTRPLSLREFWLSLIVLIFGFLVIILEFFLIRSKLIDGEHSVKFILITVIVLSTLYLITAGYGNDQIAPAVGLFGTVAGYLLGRSNSQ